MTKSQLVAQHLPYLRRYARALTGNQPSGDAYVAAMLEAIVRDPSVLDMGTHPRVALFRLFSKIWNSVNVNSTFDGVAVLSPAERHIGQITALPRQAFLLVSVERFSEEEAATILSVDRPTLQNLVEELGRELAAQIATDILIIEDELLIALDLEHLVESLGHRITGIARTRTEAIAISRAKPPGLILADIQLADGSSGLEAVNELLASFTVPVIFITAYPDRFLTGLRPEPAFLISKPYEQSCGVGNRQPGPIFRTQCGASKAAGGRLIAPAQAASGEFDPSVGPALTQAPCEPQFSAIFLGSRTARPPELDESHRQRQCEKMRRNRHNCRLRLGLAGRSRGGIAPVERINPKSRIGSRFGTSNLCKS